MKERGENLLKNLRAPVPDPEARLRAKRAALAEFENARSTRQDIKLPADVPEPSNGAFQALRRWLRLSRDETSHGSASMKWFNNRGLYAAAGVGVLAIGLSWVLPNLGKYGEDLSKPEVTASAELPADAGSQVSGLTGTDTDTGAAAAPAMPAEPKPEASLAPMPVSPPADTNQRNEAFALRAAEEKDKADDSRRDAQSKRESQQASAGRARGDLAGNAAMAPPVPAVAPQPSDANNEVVVTGMRKSLQQSMEVQRAPVGVVDAISAEDIGQLPDKQVAGPQQRIAGVAVAGKVAGITAGDGYYHEEGRDQFQHFDVNPVHRVAQEPVSTFSADVDTASYSFVRGRLNAGALPQKDSVRAEEMINYFDYAWPAAETRRVPFKPTVVVSDSPWGKGKKLVHIGIKGYELDMESAPDANLVLLLDVSGSMNSPDKLPLAVRSMEMLLDSLKSSDTVGIVVYAGAAGTVLEPTPVREKEKIVSALRSLRPGGSTAGAAGIERAYQLAEAHFRKGGVNRILLATDGDFNVGIAGTEELKGFVERKREKGVYLSVLGFGQGNYRDELAQALAQNGNGVAAYIDTEAEARKVLVQEASGSLFTIAKDVKLQVEFNPATVSEYRLVGYETRALKREDFNNDAVDAGDVGAGHAVTAIYEVTPVNSDAQSVDEPRYADNRVAAAKSQSPRGGNRAEYGFLKIRYKLPNEDKSQLISEPIPLRSREVPAAVARDVAFSTAVAGFAQLLRGNGYTGELRFDDVLRQAQASKGDDRNGYRAGFIELVRKAQELR